LKEWKPTYDYDDDEEVEDPVNKVTAVTSTSECIKCSVSTHCRTKTIAILLVNTYYYIVIKSARIGILVGLCI